MSLNGENELTFCKEYVTNMFKLLRSETPNDAWVNLRALQELEEIADKNGKTILVETKLIPNRVDVNQYIK